ADRCSSDLRVLGLFSIALVTAIVMARIVPASDGAAVEISRKPVSEIPAQYRADAAKPRKPFAVRFTCPESGRLYVVFDNTQQTATIEAGNTTRYLKQVVSADGGRYANSDASYVFWVKGKRATINGQETCEAD
ncbi:MAG: MliC family protein, partial [Fluviibacter sp.]